MKKKILISILMIMFILTGCGKQNEKDILKNLTKKIENSKGYFLTGELEIRNNEDSYLYNVEVSYATKDQYKVNLINKTNNHEQIILRNSVGVYVLTPSLNKSFKFQSEWPYNSSQSYLLQTVLNDIKNDSDRKFEKTDTGYIYTTKVNYSNNKDLVRQKIYLDKDKNISKVEVLDNSDNIKMKMQFNSMDMNSTFDNDYFKLERNMETNSNINSGEGKVSKIEETIFPMYVPANTYLSSEDKVYTDSGERIILTFAGEKPFTLVQETINEINQTIIPTSGEPALILDTIGNVSDSSINWLTNGIEYYVSSSALSQDELMSVANSMGVMPVGK